MQALPEVIVGTGFRLRRWRASDLEAMYGAISASSAHLSAWLAFMQTPQTPERLRERLARWSQAWRDGGDAEYGLFLDAGELAGAVSLLRRRGPGVLEIGYWIHAAYLRRGLASESSRLLIDAAFGLGETNAVEIHHDKANTASEGVARRLRFSLAEEVAIERRAPSEAGVDRVWRLTRQQWEDPSG